MSTPAQVWQYRTLITNLAQRDMKARYKKSVLGWLWSLINPAVTLGIYTLVFGVFLKGTAPTAGNGTTQAFALYLFCALVAWNFFNGAVNNAIGSFANAGPLLTRTYFPPECPMIAGLATVALQAGLETLILVFFMVIFGNVSWTFLLGIPILMLVACFAFGLGLILGLGNIRYRDVNYLTSIGMQVLFYATPIVYSLDAISPEYQQILKFNPLTSYTYSMRQVFYSLSVPTIGNWFVMVLSAAVSLLLGWWVFSRYAPRVIEEL